MIQLLHIMRSGSYSFSFFLRFSFRLYAPLSWKHLCMYLCVTHWRCFFFFFFNRLDFGISHHAVFSQTQVSSCYIHRPNNFKYHWKVNVFNGDVTQSQCLLCNYSMLDHSTGAPTARTSSWTIPLIISADILLWFFRFFCFVLFPV